jgi:E3 ubiquitin-protein ligase RNF19A
MEDIVLPQLSREICNYESLVTQLSAMGFPLEMVELSIANSQVKDIDDVLRFLIKTELGWDHPFIPSVKDELLCQICREVDKEHLEFAIQPVASHPIIMVRSDDAVPEGSRRNWCPICYAPIEVEWRHPDCSEHVFCRDCVIQYLSVKITESQVLELRCPGDGCRHLISEAQVKAFVPELLQKYQKFKRRAELSKDPSVRWCSHLDCEGVMKGSQQRPHMACPVCKREQCFNCGSEWHPGKTCEQLIDDAYEQWVRGREVQLCPRCKRRIEKVEGCNHMTCSVCQHQWCWLCRGAYSPNHYDPMNPLGCPNLQGSQNSREQWPIWRIYLLRLRMVLLIMLLVILSPILLLFAPSVAIARSAYTTFRGRYSQNKAYILASLMWLLGLIATPLILLIAVPLGLIALLVRCCRRLC